MNADMGGCRATLGMRRVWCLNAGRFLRVRFSRQGLSEVLLGRPQAPDNHGRPHQARPNAAVRLTVNRTNSPKTISSAVRRSIPVAPIN